MRRTPIGASRDSIFLLDTIGFIAGPHLGAGRECRVKIVAIFGGWTEVQPYTNWCPSDHSWTEF
jgi:hypothetical protein